MLYKTFAALCVREIYVAIVVLLPAAEPLSVIMTTHNFLPFHRATTHCLLLACLYTRGVHLPESPYACDEAWEVRSTPHRLPKDTPTIRMQRLCCHQKAAQRCPIGVLLSWQHKFGEHISGKCYVKHLRPLPNSTRITIRRLS